MNIYVKRIKLKPQMHNILRGRVQKIKRNIYLHVDIFQKIYEIEGKWNLSYQILCGRCFNGMGVWGVGK